MAQISQTYASPGLRWGLLLEDHPGAYVEFDTVTAVEVGIPLHLTKSPDEEFVTATIHFADREQRPPVMGYKALMSAVNGALDHPSDRFNTMCTKALGRALKRAGYPDDTTDLKALVLWRQREAEIAAIHEGSAQIQLSPANVGAAIDAAGQHDLDAVADDGELLASSDEIVALKKAIKESGRSAEVTRWCRTKGWLVTKLETSEQIAEVSEFLAKSLVPVDASQALLTVVELLAGIDEEEVPVFRAFCKSQGISAEIVEVDPSSLSEDELESLLGWLES